jgi:hypothetical protein
MKKNSVCINPSANGGEAITFTEDENGITINIQCYGSGEANILCAGMTAEDILDAMSTLMKNRNNK